MLKLNALLLLVPMLSHHRAFQPQNNLLTKSLAQSQHLLLALAISLVAIAPAVAQSVVPNNDGTGTRVDADGNTLNIDGGSLSENGENLFHSFEQFGLSESEIANFMSNPDIRNILGRINGGDASVINGLIQVTGGNSNLLLMNPAGIIFGESAQLNVPADFTATSATGIGFENNVWFNAVGENNYQTLVGTPNAFAFDSENPGVVVNAGDLSLAAGKNLTLLGGNVVNTGKIEAAKGSVTLSAVPGSSTVKIGQEGHLLSLEIEPPRDSEGNILPFSATDLPTLLTSSGTETGLTANEDGSVVITETGKSFIPEAALAINTGELNVSGFEGGAVTITGNKVGVLSGEINATGDSAGGNVRVGGEYQGGEGLPKATQTIVDKGSSIAAEATDIGNGGQVVVWSDSLTRFTGNITARGGENGGDGGLVEVSGKDLLVFTGTVDAGAALGEPGELLLDPKNIIIGDDDTALSSIFSPAPESELADIAGFGISVATVGEDLLVGSPANLSGGFNNAGQAFLFDRSGNALVTYDNPEAVQGGFFGFAVAAVSSDELLIGAPRNSIPGDEGAVPEAGQVFLFDKTSSEPLETYNNPAPGAAFISSGTFTGAIPIGDTNFGAALAVVDSDLFLVGAPGHTVTEDGNDFDRAGQAFLIGRDGETLETFDNPNPSNDGNGKGTGNSFGIAVAAVGDDLGAIGAARNDDGAGQVFIFDLDDSTPEATIDNPEAEGSRFGQSVVEVEGDDSRLAVGAPRNSEGGQVYIYDLDDTDVPIETFSNPEAEGGDFGDAIAGAGEDRLLIGARSNNGGVGEAFLFNTDDSEPVETFDNPSSNGGSFGTSVASVGEDEVLIGASENNFRGIPNSGEAFVSLTNSFVDADSFTGSLEFDTDPGATSIITPATIVSILNSGTDVDLQASNDIIIQADQEIIADNADGDGGNFSLQAGRRVEISSDITSDNGNIEIVANASTESGVVAEFRDPGLAEIEIADGVNLDAGTGDVTLNVAATGEGTRGNITLDSLTGNDVALTTGVGTVEVAGAIDGAGDLTITGNEINLRGGEDSVTGQSLTVRTTSNQDINLGNQQNTTSLDLTTTDLNALDIATGADSQIVISSDSSTGTVTLFDSVADGGSNPFENAVAIAGGDTLVAPNLDFTWDIDSGNLNNIFANGLTYSNFENYQGGTGNNILVLGDSGANSVNGGGGNNTLVGNDDNNTFNITDLDTGNINEATEFINVQNLTGGDGNDTFSFIGDTPELSGNVDGGGGSNQLDYSEFTGLDEETFVFNPDTGEATGINGTFTSIDGAIDPANILPVELENQVRSDVSNNTEADTARETERNIPTPELNLASVQDVSETSELALLQRIDSSFTQDYDNYYGRNLDGGQQSSAAELGINLAEVQQTLRTIEESTGAKPALIYAAFFPSGIDALQGRNSNILPQADDQLELVTITAEGKAIRNRIEGVTRTDVERAARRLTAGVADLQPESQFMPESQQLYKWLVEPLKEDLEAQEISNLVFLMDNGLRSLPIAALHDGEQYLIQEYSVGLMPSISLTDTRYQNINDVDLLAMGSETFPADSNLAALPAVPVEIDIITQQLWSGGSSFLDADFTIDNLKQTQTSKPFGILHLATHAEFNPGTPKNSYIQFGDRKLELDQVRELGLSNPQVELMVLSACKTAVGDYDAEYGFAGLAHQAGVKSALGSLWYISDQGTLSMMSKFYQELAEAPTKAEALRRAQVAMIEKQVRLEKGKLITASQTFDLPENIKAIDLTHPFFWSPYTIVGNPW